MKRLTLSHRLLIGSGVLFAGFVACQLSYAAIGQHIAKDGTLREPFFLIPISVLCPASTTPRRGLVACSALRRNIWWE